MLSIIDIGPNLMKAIEDGAIAITIITLAIVIGVAVVKLNKK